MKPNGGLRRAWTHISVISVEGSKSSQPLPPGGAETNRSAREVGKIFFHTTVLFTLWSHSKQLSRLQQDFSLTCNRQQNTTILRGMIRFLVGLIFSCLSDRVREKGPGDGGEIT